VADMDVAVGIRGAVMQDKAGLVGVLRLQAVIKVKVAPQLEPFRLLRGQAGLHREIGFGQENSVLVVGHESSQKRASAAAEKNKRQF